MGMAFVIGLALLIGYVGNMGAEILEKQRLQTAADAAAYSSAVCKARGMNAVSSYNHFMGELTALVVILEALGGPEAEEGKPFQTIEDTAINTVIATLGDENNPGIYFEGFSGGRADAFVVNGAVESVTEGWNGKLGKGGKYPMNKHQCGAAFYDAGVAWDRGEAFDVHHSVGVGIRTLFPQLDRVVFRMDAGFPLADGRLPNGVARASFFLAVEQAFPMRSLQAP